MKHQLFLRRNRKAQIGFMSIAFLSLFMLLAAFIIGCDKETPTGVDKQPQPENPVGETAKTIEVQIDKFSYQGRLYEKEEFQRLFRDKEFPVMVSGMGSPDKDTVYVFDTEVDFKAWTRTTPFAEKFAEMDKQIAAARLQANSKPSAETSLGKDNGTLSPGGIAVLFEHINFNKNTPGRFIPLRAGFGIPNLVNWGFNDTGSSLKVATCAGYTFCWLIEDVNYNGLFKIFRAAPSPTYPCIEYQWKDLRQYILRYPVTWNDQASSMIVL